MANKDKVEYIIVVGAGRVGKRIIELATRDGHEVVVIDEDTETAERTGANFDCLVINDDASRLDVLEEAGIEKADALIATTSNDPTNLLIMMLGRKYDVPRLLSSVREPDHISLFEELDINFVESPHRLNGEYLYRKVQRPGIKEFMRLDGGAEIVEIKISDESVLAGLSILDARDTDKIPDELNIVAIYRDEELIIPRGNTTFEAGDVVTVLSKDELDEETLETFKPE